VPRVKERDDVAAIRTDDVRCRVSGDTTASGGSGVLYGSDTATPRTHRLPFASICFCIAALVAFRHKTRPGIVVVPHPKKDLGTGLLAAIRKQAGL